MNKSRILEKILTIILLIFVYIMWQPIIKSVIWRIKWKIESKIKAHYIYNSIKAKEGMAIEEYLIKQYFERMIEDIK